MIVRLFAIGVIAGGLAIACVLYFFDPRQMRIFAPCLFNRITGLYCPGCGATRAVFSLVHLDILAAIQYNVLLVAALPFISYSICKWCIGAILGRRMPIYFMRPLLVWAIVAAIFIFWILRNLPVYPFVLLAPHGG